MAKTGKKQLRALWLQVHKWIGLTLAVLIIPISLTGSALVWHDWLDAKLEPQRHASARPGRACALRLCRRRDRRAPARRTLSALRFNKDGTPVVATATKAAEGAGPPGAHQLWLDPRDAA